MIKLATLFFILLLLAGCATVDQRADEVGDKVASANDTVLSQSERATCYGASTGAVYRRYGGDPERFNYWTKFCGHKTWPQIEEKK